MASGISVTLEPNPDGSFSGYMEVSEHQYAGDYKFSFVAFNDGKEDNKSFAFIA